MTFIRCETLRFLNCAALLYFAILGCTGNFEDAELSKDNPGSGGRLESQEAEGDENNDGLASAPSNITGTYLTGHFIGCEYVVKPTSDSPQGQLGCRLSRNEDGQKVPLADLNGQWQWSATLTDPAAAEITEIENRNSATWDVVYNINLTSNESLADIEKDIHIGIEDQTLMRSMKESLSDIQGRLTILLAGNWQEIRSGEQTCFTNSFMQYQDLAGGNHVIYFRNYFENTLSIQGERTDYFFDDPQCSGQPDYSSKVEQDYTVRSFNGEVYELDYLLQKWLVTPYSKLGLEIVKREYSCVSFNPTRYRVGRVSNIISCWPEDIKTFYTAMKYQEPNKLFLAQSSDPTAGYTPESRLREFNMNVRLEKISP